MKIGTLELQKEMIIKLSLITISFSLLYADIISYLIHDWSIDENYSHGYIVPFVSAYLIWERRDELLSFRPESYFPGLMILIGGLLLFLLGHVGAELFLGRLSMIVVLSGTILFLLGREYFKLLAFPVAFLIFMIPLPAVVFNAIAFPLQLFAAKVSTNVISLIGIPVFRDGNVIHLAQTTLEVAEACSGIRSLVTILTLATIFAYFMVKGRWRQSVLVLSSFPIAIFTNSARVTLTAILSHYYGQEAAQGFYHSFEGWFMFIIAFGLLLLFGALLKKLPR